MADPVWTDGVTPLNSLNMTKLQTRDEKAAVNGYASLDVGGKVPAAQLPDLSAAYQAKSEKGVANGYAPLDAGGQLSDTRMPPRFGTVGRGLNTGLGGNLNNVVDVGWYYALPGDLNTPAPSTYFGVLVTNVSDQAQVRQIAYDYQTDDVWMRRRFTNTWQPWVKVWPLDTYSATPPASPFDGQLWTFPADATNGVMWQFRYRAASASAYKWEFVGGPALYALYPSAQSVAAISVWTSGAPTIAVARSGEYLVDWSAQATPPATGICQVAVTQDGVNPAYPAALSQVPAGTPSSLSSSQTLFTLFAGNIQHIYWNVAASTSWGNRQLAILPRRVA